jgi:glutathione S-transferase
MLTVIHLEGSRSDRLIWLLEELGLDYEVEAFEREDGRAPAAMKALHPLAKAPMLRDGDRILIESGAIFEYLLARHGDGGLVPAVDDPDWPDYVQWLHFAEGSAMLPMVLDHYQQAGLCGPPGETPIAELARSELDRLYDHLESVLSERPWLAGDRFTAADGASRPSAGAGPGEGRERLSPLCAAVAVAPQEHEGGALAAERRARRREGEDVPRATRSSEPVGQGVAQHPLASR